MYICDPAWENRAYLHIKFDHDFRLWSFIPLCLNTGFQTLLTGTADNGEFNAYYRTGIACLDSEIHDKM